MGAKFSYRADIDGLRAVAVLSVLLFHIDFSWVPGGYTGVDIFFVISGFLITRIIGLDIERRKFSLRWFYVRRIRRILPAFYAVTATTMLVGFILLLPGDLHSLLSSIRHALLFAANIYFSRDKGYFDISADEKPMLHIWSLSIEEQYYFIWPLLLVLIYAVGHLVLKQHKSSSRLAVIAVTFTLIVAAFVYTQKALIASPGATNLYFLLQTRFSELMIGSLTALLPFHGRLLARRLMAYAGGLLIALGLMTLNKDSIFPGYNALFPCLGAALLIYSGQGGEDRKTWLHKVLGLRVMAVIGLLSYSIYLWHWPVLAYMRYVYGSYSLPWHWILQAVALTFALAFITYRYVERNTKTVSFGFSHALFGVFLTPAFLIIAATYGLEKARPIQKPSTELASYGVDICHGNLDKDCVRGDLEKEPSVLMIGDSHAAALNSLIDVVGRHEGWAAKVVTGSSCSPVFRLDENVLPIWARKPCSDLKAFIAENYRDYGAVFIASSWAYQLGMQADKPDPHYLQKLEKTLREMAKTTPVYVFSDVPALPVSPLRLVRFSELALTVNRPFSQVGIRANNVVRNLAQSIQNVYWVDLEHALSGFHQWGLYDGKPTYFDDHHLNVYGATVLGELFVKSGARILSQ